MRPPRLGRTLARGARERLTGTRGGHGALAFVERRGDDTAGPLVEIGEVDLGLERLGKWISIQADPLGHRVVGDDCQAHALTTQNNLARHGDVRDGGDQAAQCSARLRDEARSDDIAIRGEVQALVVAHRTPQRDRCARFDGGDRQHRGGTPVDWTLLMAGTAIAAIPVLVVYIIGQRKIIEGITLTGLTGR